MSLKKVIEFLGFNLKENKSGIYQKKYVNENRIFFCRDVRKYQVCGRVKELLSASQKLKSVTMSPD